MQISVLVEPVAGNGYRAKGAEPFGFSAEGATREEAIAKVRQLCQARLSGGAPLPRRTAIAEREKGSS
jgi:predicted RNase H-like HicB family nuclease